MLCSGCMALSVRKGPVVAVVGCGRRVELVVPVAPLEGTASGATVFSRRCVRYDARSAFGCWSSGMAER